MVQSSSTTPDRGVEWWNRTYRRFEVADLWTTPPGPGWSRVVQPGPGWSTRSPAGSGPPCGQTARRTRQGRLRDRTAASLAARSAACGADRSGSQGGAAHPRAGGQWTTLDHPPTWSKVVQCGPCGPGSAVCEGGSPSSRSDVQTTRKAISRRLAEFGPVRQGIPIDLLGGPPPGLASRES